MQDDFDDVEPADRVGVRNDFIVAAEKETLQQQQATRLNRLSEFQSETLARLFLERVEAQTAHRCDGQCGAHYCVGERHTELVAAAHDPSDEFAERTVSCDQYYGEGRCMSCTAQRYVEGEFARDLWAQAISDIQRRDSAKAAPGRSISLAEVSPIAPLPLTDAGQGAEGVDVLRRRA